MTAPYDQVVGRKAFWLLEVDAGRVYRWADIAVEVPTAQEEILHFEGGLVPPRVTAAGIGGTEVEQQLEVVDSQDWGGLEAALVDLEFAKARLWRLYAGQVLEQADLVLEGIVTEPSHGEQHEGISFNLVRPQRLTANPIPSGRAVVDEVTWPDAGGYAPDEKALGASYPVPFGFPGIRPSGKALAAWPALLVRSHSSSIDEYLLVSALPIHASGLRVWDYSADPPESEVLTVQSTVDDSLGRRVGLIDTSAATITIAEGREYWVGSNDSSALGGGIWNRDRTAPLRGLGEVWEWVVQTFTGMRIDRGRMAAVGAFLNRYKVDTAVTAPVDAWDWLESEILPMAPVDIRQSRHGVFLSPWLQLRRKIDAVATLNADTGPWEVLGRVERNAREIVNEVSVEYAFVRGQQATERLVVTGHAGDIAADPLADPTALQADARVYSSHIAAVSQARYGRRSQTIALRHTWDTATAARVAMDRIAHAALPGREVSMRAPRDFADWIPDGETVLVESSDHGLSGVVGVVSDKELSDAFTTLVIELRDDPVQRTRGAVP